MMRTSLKNLALAGLLPGALLLQGCSQVTYAPQGPLNIQAAFFRIFAALQGLPTAQAGPPAPLAIPPTGLSCPSGTCSKSGGLGKCTGRSCAALSSLDDLGPQAPESAAIEEAAGKVNSGIDAAVAAATGEGAPAEDGLASEDQVGERWSGYEETDFLDEDPDPAVLPGGEDDLLGFSSSGGEPEEEVQPEVSVADFPGAPEELAAAEEPWVGPLTPEQALWHLDSGEPVTDILGRKNFL